MNNAYFKAWMGFFMGFLTANLVLENDIKNDVLAFLKTENETIVVKNFFLSFLKRCFLI